MYDILLHNQFVGEIYYLPSLLIFTLVLASTSLYLFRFHNQLQRQLALVNKELNENDLSFIHTYIHEKGMQILAKLGHVCMHNPNDETNIMVAEHKMIGINGIHYFVNFFKYNEKPSLAQNIKATIAFQKLIHENDVLEIEETSGVLHKNNIFVQAKPLEKIIAHIRIDEFCKGKLKLHFFTNNVVCILLRNGTNIPQRYPQKTAKQLKNDDVLTPFKFDLGTNDLLYFIELNANSELLISNLLELLKKNENSTRGKHEQIIRMLFDRDTENSRNDFSNISCIGIHI